MNAKHSMPARLQFGLALLAIELVLVVGNLAVTSLLNWRGLEGYALGLVCAGVSVIVVGLIGLTAERPVGAGTPSAHLLVMPSPLIAPLWVGHTDAPKDAWFVVPLTIAGLGAIGLGAMLLWIG